MEAEQREEEAGFRAFRLPSGRHGIPPEQVEENQRWRLLGAAAEVLRERGYAETTSQRVAFAAGVSSSTFYKYFDDVGACLLAAYRLAAGCLLEVVVDGCQRADAWEEQVRGAIDAGLAFLAAEPGMARLLGAEAPIGLVAIDIARVELLSRLAARLATGRPAAEAGLPPGQERHLVAGAFALVAERVATDSPDRLTELAPELAALLTSSSGETGSGSVAIRS